MLFLFPSFLKVVRLLNWHLQTSERHTDRQMLKVLVSALSYVLYWIRKHLQIGWAGYVVYKESICMPDWEASQKITHHKCRQYVADRLGPIVNHHWWMGGWMGRWMDGWMDGWMDRWTDGRVSEWVGGWLAGWMHRGIQMWRFAFSLWTFIILSLWMKKVWILELFSEKEIGGIFIHEDKILRNLWSCITSKNKKILLPTQMWAALTSGCWGCPRTWWTECVTF